MSFYNNKVLSLKIIGILSYSIKSILGQNAFIKFVFLNTITTQLAMKLIACPPPGANFI